MTQVATTDTVEVEEALDTITGEPKAIRISNDDEITFIRVAPEEDHRDEFLVNVHISVIGDRRTVQVEDEKVVQSAIRNADTAQIVQVNNSPWSPLYNE